jgi:hypothetical protein
MAERRGRTIDPDQVNSVDTWLRFSKRKYTNLYHRESDGAFLVLNPTAPDVQSPVKTFTMTKGKDAIAVLLRDDTSSELRAEAETRLGDLSREQAAKKSVGFEAYREVEHQLMEAIQSWKISDAPKAEKAMKVGRIQAQLETLDAARSKATYPIRYIQEGIHERRVIDSATQDARKIPYELYCTVVRYSDPATRSIAKDTV